MKPLSEVLKGRGKDTAIVSWKVAMADGGCKMSVQLRIPCRGVKWNVRFVHDLYNFNAVDFMDTSFYAELFRCIAFTAMDNHGELPMPKQDAYVDFNISTDTTDDCIVCSVYRVQLGESLLLTGLSTITVEKQERCFHASRSSV